MFSQLILGQNTFYNNADMVFLAKDAELHVFGNVLTTGVSATLLNQGLVQTYNDVNNGDFELNNGGTVRSKGDFLIENDWINNATLLIDSGLVDLYGSNQWITGSEISYFWNLSLTGSDKKELAIDAHVKSVLDLTSLEFSVHDKTLYIDSSNLFAIIYDGSILNNEGIISTDEDGVIRKKVIINEDNLIPTGSSEGVFRHRPIIATKKSGSIVDTVFVTFHNHTPSLMNLYDYDLNDSLCEVQSRYFYTFNCGEQTSDFQIDFAHEPTIDEEFLYLATWDVNLWDKVSNSSNLFFGNYPYVRANSFTGFIDQYFTLARINPLAPYIKRDTIACYQVENFIVELPQNQPNYIWSLNNENGSVPITSGQGTEEVIVNLGSTLTGTVYLQYQDINGCYSYKDSIEFTNGSVNANFNVLNNSTLNFESDVVFVNQSSPNTNDSEWIVQGSSTIYSGTNTFSTYTHVFEQNSDVFEYEVTLIAHSDLGDCYDTVRELIKLNDLFVFYAPNIFTPNGDGHNDVFHAETSRISKMQLTIYNRWGEIIHVTEGVDPSEVSWNGTYRGNLVQQGTYTYKFLVWPQNISYYGDEALEFIGSVSPLK